MKRNSVLLIFCVVLLILPSLMIVVPSTMRIGPDLSDLPSYIRHPRLAASTNVNDFVDTISDLHAPTDIGTHDAFSDMQSLDSVYDELAEEDMGVPTDFVDFVDALSDLRSPSDLGTHSSFAEMQDRDGNYDTLTEEDTGTPATNIHDYVDTVSNLHTPTDMGTHSSFAEEQDYDSVYDTLTEADQEAGTSTFGFAYGSGTTYVTTVANAAWGQVGTSTYSGTVASITVYGRGSSATNAKAIICSSSGVILANGVSGSTAWSTTAGNKVMTFATPPSVTAGTVYHIYVIGQAAIRIYYGLTTGGSSRLDSSNSYTTPTDPTDSAAGTYQWRNFIATVNNINQRLDLEVGWTTADYDETNEQLCVYGGTQNAEALMVDVYGYEWTNVIADLAPGWNNVSISGYLIDTGFEIRFVDSTTTGDGSQGTWQVEGVLLHCWTAGTSNYRLDLEVGWTTAEYSETNEQLCVYGGTQNAEALMVDIWNAGGSAWVNVIADLTASAWNNVSISSYLIDATVEIRFIDGTQSSDASQGSWEVEGVLLHCWTPDVNYQLDLEVGWTAADYDENNEELCIKAGTLSAIENIAVAVWSGAWTTIDSALSPSSWNNYTITSYLVSAAFEIRFFDEQQSGDTSQTSWNFDAVLLHCWSVNADPVNDQAPTCADLDDTDNLYAEYEEYAIIAYVSDTNGYADIDYVDMSFYSDDDLTLYWTMRYDEDTNSFSEQSDASDYVEMSGSSAARTGNDIDATFQVRVHWNHPDVSDIDVRVYVIDVDAGDDDDYYETVWDVETRLDYTVAPAVTDDDAGQVDSGDLDEAFHMTGTLCYYGSSLYPSSDEVDVWVSCSSGYGTNIGPWSDTVLSSGAFDVTCYADDEIPGGAGTDTYAVKPVVDGAGSSGTSLYYTTDLTDSYHPDQIVVVSYSVSDSHDNINENVNIDVTLEYDSYGTSLTTGSVTVEGYSASHQGSGVWRITRTSTTVTNITYDLAATAGDDTYGITGVDQNSQSTWVVWDRVQVQDIDVSDSRDNINENVVIGALLYYDYDNSPVTDGTVTIQGVAASHTGSGWWNITENYGVVCLVSYNSIVTSGNGYDISEIDMNGQAVDVIWDRVVIITTTVSDSRVNIDGNAEVRVTAYLDYDDDYLGSGDSITLDGASMSWDAGNSWFELSRTESGVGLYTYFVNSTSDAVYGITSLYLNGKSVNVIFDQVLVTAFTASDTRDNIYDTVNVYVTLVYDYDDTYVDDGSVWIEGLAATFVPGMNYWSLAQSKSSVDAYLYDEVTCSGNEHGITEVDTDGKSVSVIFDRIQVRSYTVSDSRDDINDYVTVDVWLIYDYDNTNLTSATSVTIEGISATHLGSGVWRINVTSATVTMVTYDTVAVSGTMYDITYMDQNGQDTDVIWDRVQVQSYSVSDTRDNIGDNVNIDVWLVYDYDNTNVTDGSVTVNGIAASHQGSGVWRAVDSEASVVQNTYDTVACSGNGYGITEMDQNGQSTSVIWDRIQVVSYSVSDSRDNINENVNIDVILIYDFDDTSLTDGTVQINGFSAAHQGGGVWRITRTSASVTSVTYNTITSGGDGTYGIGEVDQNGQSTSVIWDRIQVSGYAITDDRIAVGTTGYVNVTLVYDYDDSLVTTGIVTVNGYAASHLGSGVWRISLTSSTVQNITINSVTVSGNAYDISSVDQNGKAESCVFDRVDVNLFISDTWTLAGLNVTITYNGTFEYDAASWTGIPTLNSTGGTFYPGEAIAGNYTYVVLSITDPLYGIFIFNESSVFCFFDGVVISSGPAYFWVQYSPTAVWLIWGVASSYQWLSNSSAVTDGSMVTSMMNGTSNAEAATYGGSISGLAIGPFSSSWYHVNLTIVIDVGVTFLIWEVVLDVNILHSIHIEDSGMDVQDEWITFYFHTNWNNASFTVWDNITGTPVEVGYSSSEGWYQIVKPTVVGTHVYIIIVNGSHSGSSSTSQTCDTDLTSDSWKWLIYRFTVNPVTLLIVDLIVLQNNASVVIGGFIHTPSLTLTWNVTENGILVDSGTIVLAASGNYATIYWMKSTPLVLTNFTFMFVAGSSSLSINGYSFVMETTTYYLTYGAGSYEEGDTINNYYTEDTDPQTFVTFVIAVTSLVFLSIFIGGIVMWWEKRKEKRQDFRAAVGGGQ